MDEFTKRKLEMGKRALEFCRAHPDSNPQWTAAVARLEALLARADQLQALEANQRKLHAGPGSTGKVIPLYKRSRDKPTDPAA